MPPTHYHDPRRWFLPASTNQIGRILRQDCQWGAPSSPATPAPQQNLQQQLAIVAHVAEEVNKLSVQDPPPGERHGVVQQAASPRASVASKQLDTDTPAAADGYTVPSAAPHTGKGPSWKRRANKENKADSKEEVRTTQGFTLGAPRRRSEEADAEDQPAAKRTVLQVTSLKECLGEENLRMLKE